ncbi:hypothetical protein SDC9_123016 [bioreactor metagenome]|uniref:Uncharacterized protein n=1 Tax=bioreactor metagenome TaxID=1076179 RepID=A0A645CGI4_9ZZZZ
MAIRRQVDDPCRQAIVEQRNQAGGRHAIHAAGQCSLQVRSDGIGQDRRFVQRAQRIDRGKQVDALLTKQQRRGAHGDQYFTRAK